MSKGVDDYRIEGASELVVRDDDGKALRVINLDSTAPYTIHPGDGSAPPEVTCDGEIVPAFDQKVVSVAAGSAHSAAILEDGSLWTWGRNGSGQLGDGTYEDRLSPVKIMDDVVSVSLGDMHSGAIKSDGSLWMWGRNKYGSLGDGTTTTRTTPVKVMDGARQVSCGNGTTAALKDDGTLWVWGYAGLDGLGIGEPASLYDYRSKPVLLARGVASVSMGSVGAYVTTGGELYAWGAGTLHGNVGTGRKENVFSPTKIMDGVSSVDVDITSAAVKRDGTLWLWGNLPGTAAPTKVLDGVSSVAVGFGTVTALMRDGSVQTYGSNDYGQLGNGSTGGSTESFSKVCEGMAAVASGDYFVATLDADGVLYTWGRNNYGQLGNGCTEDLPVVTATADSSSAPITRASAIDISKATITDLTDVPYTGRYVTPPVRVTLGGKTLEESWDYTVDYEGNVEAGDATVVISGRGAYSGTVRANFKITPADVKNATVSGVVGQTYTGAALRPAITVRMDTCTLTEGVDYTVAYSGNINAGTATARVLGKGNYTGEKRVEFAIAKAEQTVTASGGTVSLGESLALGARASGGGKLTYASSDGRVASVGPSGVVTPVGVGVATISIEAAETANYRRATANVKVTVSKGTSSVSLATQAKTYTGKALAYSGKVTRTGSSGDITYAYYGDAACTQPVNAANVRGAGTYYVRATLAADTSFEAATSEAVKFTVAKAPSTIELAAQTKAYTGKALAYSGEVNRTGSNGKVSYAYYSDQACKKSVKAANVKAVGTYYVRATVAADANHEAATSAVTKFTVKKAANPMRVKTIARTAKLATVKKKAVTVASPVSFTTKARGKVTNTKVAKGSSAALTVNKETGKVTVRKGTKKGTYTVKVKVTAAGNANYDRLTKTVTCKVTVK